MASRTRHLLPKLFLGAALLACPAAVHAHSVAQVQTAKRIAQSTVVLLDPQGNPTPGGMGTDTKAQVGDILTFVIQFTPVPNNATRGGGGYITEYVPANTEVVGARLLDATGKTVAPKRGGQYNDGYGPQARHNVFDNLGLEQGSLSAHYADTGIFFSTDARTARAPANDFITVLNGIVVNPAPTGAGQLDQLLGFTGPPFYSHNAWDQIQTLAYGVSGGSIGSNGRGNTPFLYGSAVAGPETHYPYEKVASPACSDGMDNDGDGPMDYPADPECASALDDDETATADGPTGPWQRIKYTGSEIGTGMATDCSSCQGTFVRVGVPTDLGWELSPDNPLPAGTNAVRFAVGELIVGQEYFAEISLRVTGLPLDPTMNADVNCAEVFGGDAAMPQNGQDNTWRYFVPSPSCVQLNLFFELSVDKLLAVQGDKLVYTIKGKNLSVNPQTNVVVTDTFDGGDVSFSQVLVGPAPTVANGLLTWPTMNLAAGDAYEFSWEMNVNGNSLSTLNRARYTSDALPTPGFSVVALTTIEPIVVMGHAAAVVPSSTTAGSNVAYTLTLTNEGTGLANVDGASFVAVTLPAGFSFCAPATCPQPTINAAPVANPTVTGQTLRFTNGLQDIPAHGGQSTITFHATVDGAVTPGLYTIDLQTQYDDLGIGRDVENSTFGIAPLLVDVMQSDPPVLDEPVLAGATTVTGTTTEGPGAEVTVYVNGNPATPVVAGVGGVFSAAVPTLFAGQHLNATAKAPTEIVSVQSSPDVVVQGVVGAACGDGIDNDGDTLIDFPDDPGCSSPTDPDETDVPACSDGEDNDGDTLVDFPDDPSCSSYLDDDESGPPACSDGVDDDGDGLIDFPADPGCDSADDPSEVDYAACSNGIDDDADGLVDYPTDPGCSSPNDDVEDDFGAGGAGGVGGAGTGAAAAGVGGGTGVGGAGVGGVPDRGGVPETAPTAGDDGGCSCRAVGHRSPAGAWLSLLAAAALGVRRRRR